MTAILNTLFIGRNHIRLDEIDSTNEYLKKMADALKPAEGTVVSAAYQTDGKGQRGSTWQSESGLNILLSVLLYPKLPGNENQFILSQSIALACHDFIKTSLPAEDVKIKWPNDIRVNDRKIAGILIENNYQGTEIRYSIVGMGINIMQENLPSEAVSMTLLTGKAYEMERMEARLFSCLESRYLQLKNGKYKQIKEEYLTRLWGLGHKLSFMNPKTNEVFQAAISGIGERGFLKLLNEEGEKEYDLKEIRFL